MMKPHSFIIGKLYKTMERRTLSVAVKQNNSWSDSGVVTLPANSPVLVVAVNGGPHGATWAVALAADCNVWLHTNDCEPI